jgi:RNA polymerase sigma-32 factor
VTVVEMTDSNNQLPSLVKGSRELVRLSPLQLYLREIARYPLLDPEDEYETAVKLYEEGDASAAHRLVTANLRLVVKIASDFQRSQLNFMDLIQEGNFGLVQAVKRFNPYKGVKLSSYAAWWIRAYILKHLMDSKSQVRIGTTAAQRKLFFNLRKQTEKLLAEYDHVDTKLLAASLDVREKDVIEMQQRLGGGDISLDAPVGDDPKSPTQAEVLVADTPRLDDAIADEEIRQVFRSHLEEFRGTLKGRDLEVFESRMMAESPLTLQEVGERYKISRERARQIEANILKKLKAFVQAKGRIDVGSR